MFGHCFDKKSRKDKLKCSKSALSFMQQRTLTWSNSEKNIFQNSRLVALESPNASLSISGEKNRDLK